MAQNVFQFFVEPSLQELFRDKDTGLPLSNGEIFFWKKKPEQSLSLFMQ